MMPPALQGVITSVKQSAGVEEAHILLTDLKRVRIKLPWLQIGPYLYNGGDPSAILANVTPVVSAEIKDNIMARRSSVASAEEGGQEQERDGLQPGHSSSRAGPSSISVISRLHQYPKKLLGHRSAQQHTCGRRGGQQGRFEGEIRRACGRLVGHARKTRC